MSNLEGIQPADTKGTGWRVSGRTGKKWFRIERGSKEWEDWKLFYRKNAKGDLASAIDKMGYSFVFGPSPMQHGDAQLMYLNQIQENAA